MFTKKTAISFFIIAFCFPRFANGQEQFPDWVPKEAVEIAKRGWTQIIESHDVEHIARMYGLTSKEEAIRCVLKYPYKRMAFDFLGYEKGENIIAHLHTNCGHLDNAFGFAIYLDDFYHGQIRVQKRDGAWSCTGGSGGGYSLEDPLGLVYSEYGLSCGHVYIQLLGGEYLVLENERLIEMFDTPLWASQYMPVDPEQHILDVKTQIMERREILGRAGEKLPDPCK